MHMQSDKTNHVVHVICQIITRRIKGSFVQEYVVWQEGGVLYFHVNIFTV